MALSPTRMEFRLQLAHTDRGINLTETFIIGRHPSETGEHLTLRVLAWCLLNEDRLELGPGLSSPNTPDLWTHDLTGRLTTWIECGNAQSEDLRRVLQQNAGTVAHVVLSDAERARELMGEISAWRKPLPVSLWTVDSALVAALGARDQRRQRWSVTISGDHFYIDADGENLDGEVVRAEPNFG